jgi:ribosomal protein S18 acetylase RimI-like enzyme
LSLILVASIQKMLLGYKVAYKDGQDLYSWMGGVLPEYRKMGIAKKLADEQET